MNTALWTLRCNRVEEPYYSFGAGDETLAPALVTEWKKQKKKLPLNVAKILSFFRVCIHLVLRKKERKKNWIKREREGEREISGRIAIGWFSVTCSIFKEEEEEEKGKSALLLQRCKQVFEGRISSSGADPNHSDICSWCADGVENERRSQGTRVERKGRAK